MLTIEVKEARPRIVVNTTDVKLQIRPNTLVEEIHRLAKIATHVRIRVRLRTHATARGRFNFHSNRLLMHVGERQKVIGDFRFDSIGTVWEHGDS